MKKLTTVKLIDALKLLARGFESKDPDADPLEGWENGEVEFILRKSYQRLEELHKLGDSKYD